MISNDAIKSSIPLVQALASKGRSVVAVQGTPLESLVKATGGVEVFDSSDNDKYSEIYLTTEIANSTNDMSGAVPNQHNILMDELIPVIGDRLRRHISYARNVVSPAIEQLADRTKEILSGLTPSALLGMEITTFTPSKLFSNGTLLSSAGKSEDVKFDAGYALPFYLPTLSAEEIVASIKENVPGVGKDFDEWVDQIGAVKLEEIYRDFFTADSGVPGRVSIGLYINGLGAGVSCDLDKLMGIYLMAVAFFTDVRPGVEANIRRYETELGYLRDIAGSRLSAESKAYDEAIEKNDLLIYKMDGRKIVVYEENYKRFLDDGGENEAIFGAAVSGSRLRRVSELLAAKDELEKIWNRQVGIVSVTESNRRFARLKEALNSTFLEMMKEEVELDPQFNPTASISLFEAELEKTVAAEMDCLYTLSTRLLCRSRYAHTDAEKILEGINSVCKENPKLDVREAAAISAINYCAYWVFSQMKVV